MSKLVTMSRSRAGFLTRFSSEYIGTGDKDTQMQSVLVPDGRAVYFERTGKYLVEENNSPSDVFTSFSVEKLSASNVPNDANRENAAINQNAVTVAKINDNEYTVSANFTELKEYQSTNVQQGSHLWVGITIDTGEDTIVGIKWNGSPLTEADVTDAESVGLSAGGIIFWLKMDDGESSVVLTKENSSSVITFIPINTKV